MVATPVMMPATATVPSAEHAPLIPRANAVINKVDGADKAFHDWYRFVLSFPPHLVRDYIGRFDLARPGTATYEREPFQVTQ